MIQTFLPIRVIIIQLFQFFEIYTNLFQINIKNEKML